MKQQRSTWNQLQCAILYCNDASSILQLPEVPLKKGGLRGRMKVRIHANLHPNGCCVCRFIVVSFSEQGIDLFNAFIFKR
uniref:Uncharacterized protein n=1 Tax=Parascaris univalens TaxID=6257 RepID=A0A915BUY1_PARUN